MFPKLITDRRGPVAYLVLNTPERRNAVSLDMWQSIPGILAELEDDATIRCIVLTGSGTESFCAGADISEFDTNRASVEAAHVYDRATGAAITSITRTDKPVLAAIRGTCFGGGVALAMACDLRLAAVDARFCIPAARLGVAYGVAATANLSARVGASLAAEMLLTGRVYSAHEALMQGMVHQVVPVSDFETTLAGYAGMVASNAPLSLAASKRAIRATMTGEASDRTGAEDAARTCARSADYAEGRRAFAEKRKPRFNGN
jgi:enoyl-CoA hydratase